MSEPEGQRESMPVFKVSTGLMAALFAYAAIIQWNDPDPARWVAVYLCGSALALAPLFWPILPTATLALAMVATAWALSLVPGIFAAMALTGTEEERELAGHFQIRSIPTLMIFREQIIVFSQPGALPPAALEDVLGKVAALDMDDVRRQVAEQANSDEAQA